MKQVMLKEVKKGDYFTLNPIENPSENQVYVREDFDRIDKVYWCSKFNDICCCRYLKGDKVVYVGFTF